MILFLFQAKPFNLTVIQLHCIIVLISHASNIILKILQARLQQYVNWELPDVQAGFRKGRTRNQFANIHWIIEKERGFQKNIYFCFTDYAKTLDCVNHNKLWNILKEMGVPNHLTWETCMQIKKQQLEPYMEQLTWFQIRKGIWQGCILSPCLFNLYAEYIKKNVGVHESQAGIKTAGRNINNLTYADGTTLKRN